MAVVALVVVLATGSAFFIVPALGCMLVMGAMMMAMGGHRGSDRSEND